MRIMRKLGVTVVCGRIEGIATGAELTCAIGGAGAVHRVMCFGSNWSGQLGLGYSSARETRPLRVTGIDDAIAITAGENHACVLRAGGTVACWGRNDYGQLGDGSTMTRTRPVAVSGLTGVVQVEAGDFHTCARLADGTARCWGNNGAGAVGDGTTVSARPTPVSVVGLTNSIDINAGGQHTCAVRIDGSAYCWGEQTLGRLGNGTAAPGVVRSPVAVSGLVDAVRIAAGLSHVCASRTTGEVVCWGSDSSGQIGRGVGNDSTSVPALVPGIFPSAVVTAYRNHTCSRPTTAMPARPVQCWGANDDGQIGDGSMIQADVPTSVIGSTVFTIVSAGAGHTCASDGASMSCWGRNGSGQLGDGTIDSRSTPTPVAL